MGCFSGTNAVAAATKKPEKNRVLSFKPPFQVSAIYAIQEHTSTLSLFQIRAQSYETCGFDFPAAPFKKDALPSYFRIAIMKQCGYLCGGQISSGSSAYFLGSNFQILFALSSFGLFSKRELSEPKANMGICVLSENSFVLAGGNNGQILATTELYNTISDLWYPLAPLNIPRYGLGLCPFNEKQIYAIGGCRIEKSTEIEKECNYIEVYELGKADKGWMIVPIYICEYMGSIDLICFQATKEGIIIAGGVYEDTSEANGKSAFYFYDVSAGRIEATGDMGCIDAFVSTANYYDQFSVYIFGTSKMIHIMEVTANT